MKSLGHHKLLQQSLPPSPVFSRPTLASKVHACQLINFVFPPLLSTFSYFPFTVPCEIVMPKPEDQPPQFLFSQLLSKGCLDLSTNILIGDMILVQDIQLSSVVKH